MSRLGKRNTLVLAHAVAIACGLSLGAGVARADNDAALPRAKENISPPARPPERPGTGKPNIVFILTDDMGIGDLGCFGGTFATTPNLDRLASEGLRLTQFYVASPICSPSRVACTTGMFPSRWNINSYLQSRKGNHQTQQVDFLDPKAPSLARQLKLAGYKTAHFGKWHMGGGRDVDDAPPISAYGFDEWSSTEESPHPRTDPKWHSPDPKDPERRTARYERTGFWVNKTIDFLRRNKGKPCYVNLWPDDVHDPHEPRPETLAKLGANPVPRAMSRATMEDYDAALGKLLDFLKSEGLEENTLVVFTGDNGPNPSYHRARTAGLRGQKWSLYEGGLREGLIVKWKGRIPAGCVDNTTVSGTVDLMPTLCALTGAPLPHGFAMDGLDVGGAWRGQPMERNRPLFWDYGRGAGRLPPGGQDDRPLYHCDTAGYLRPGASEDRSPELAIREGKWKCLVNADGTALELYDMNADPKESANVAAGNIEVAKRLSEKVRAWRKSLPAPAVNTKAGSLP